MKKIIILCFFVILIFSACSVQNNLFVYYLKSNITSVDPQTSNDSDTDIVITSLFEGLCNLDEMGNAVPGVAVNWTAENGNTLFTFYLDENAKWSNGEQVTAYDFEFAFERSVQPIIKSEDIYKFYQIKNAEAIHKGLLDSSLLGAYAKDDFTFVVSLEHSNPNFPKVCATPKFMPCNKEFFESTNGKYGLDVENTLTNGPFVFANNYAFSETLSLVKSDTYHFSHTVKPNNLILTTNYEESSVSDPVQALTNHTVDILKIDYKQSIDAASAGLSVFSQSDKVTSLIFNSEYEFLSNSTVRKLFFSTIERNEIENLLPNNCVDSKSLLPDSLYFNGFKYNDYTNPYLLDEYIDNTKEEFDSLLSQLDDKQIQSINILCTNTELDIAIANQLVISWNKNFKTYMNIDAVSEIDYQQRLASGDYEIAIYTTKAENSDALNFFELFKSNSEPQLLNSKSYDDMFNFVGSDISACYALERYLIEQSIVYPLYSTQSYYGYSKGLKNVILHNNYIDFSHATK